MIKLTERQAAVLAFIRAQMVSRGFPPTFREIGAHMGIRSTNGVNDHLRALERKGYLTREDMTSRGIRVVETLPADAVKMGQLSPLASWEPWLELKLRNILAGYNMIATREGKLVTDFAGELAHALAGELRNP